MCHSTYVANPSSRTGHHSGSTVGIHSMYRVSRTLSGSSFVPAEATTYQPAASPAAGPRPRTAERVFLKIRASTSSSPRTDNDR